VLLVIGLLAGLVTGISPCILPVVPVVFAAGTSRRPVRIVAGLIVSFSAFTLFGTWLLSALGLPDDLLRDLGLVVLVVVALGLIFPALGHQLERPFARLVQNRGPSTGGGFVLGLSLGVLYVPCAGPVLAAITVVGSSHHIGVDAVLLTVAFAIGAAIPLLGFALAGQGLAARLTAVRTHAGATRKVAGVVLILSALAIGSNLTDGLQRHVPGYTASLQRHIEQGGTAKDALAKVTGRHTTEGLSTCAAGTPGLVDCGPAPAIRGIASWLNTPDGTPLTLAGLKGRVVLVDFWTYSCINCQRTLPHLQAWDRAYRDDGLTIIGVHTPEFAFEHVQANVRRAAKSLGVTWPIALDNDYGTWNAYGNQYWPAEYLIDAHGTIRHVSFGEGDYDRTESQIRTLLADARPEAHLGSATKVADATPTEQLTPETYLGSERAVPGGGPKFVGTWNVGAQRVVAGEDASLVLRYQAAKVYLVLGGTGAVQVRVDGKPTKTVHVGDEPTLYTLVDEATSRQALLDLRFTPGVQAYAFTFG
jgi:cytochrome c biogenesis protein CcdA/thiol-disulfide isomerase/thioredoxin